MITQQLIEFEKFLNQKYADYLRERSLHLTLDRPSGRLLLQGLLKNPAETYYYPVELMVKAQGLSADQELLRIALLLDFLEAYLEEFFTEDEQVLLPIDWNRFELDGLEIFARGQILNRKLENMADAWLAQEHPDLNPSPLLH